MPASFSSLNNPDSLSAFHGLSEAGLGLAKTFEQIADMRQKEILERMGVKGISRYTHIVTAKNYAQKQKNIVIKHFFDESHPDLGGWFFYENDKLKVSLGHPYLEEGRIKMKVQEHI